MIETQHETQETVTAWAIATFGNGGSDLRCATRANEEMAELLSCLSRAEPDMDAVRLELADVCIVLWRLGTRLGIALDTLDSGASPSRDERTALHRAACANEYLGFVMFNLSQPMAPNIRGAKSSVHSAWRVLLSTALDLGIDLQAAINAKMKINRARVWRKDGSGHGYHVKAQP